MYGEPDVIYRPEIRQLVPHLVVVAVVLVAAVALADPALVGIAFLGLLIVVFMLRRYGTQLRDDGIVVLGITNRFIPWPAIEDVSELAQAGGRGVVVRESGGRRTLLKAPRDARMAPDPDYDEKRDRIILEWSANR